MGKIEIHNFIYNYLVVAIKKHKEEFIPNKAWITLQTSLPYRNILIGLAPVNVKLPLMYVFGECALWYYDCDIMTQWTYGCEIMTLILWYWDIKTLWYYYTLILYHWYYDTVIILLIDIMAL